VAAASSAIVRKIGFSPRDLAGDLTGNYQRITSELILIRTLAMDRD